MLAERAELVSVQEVSGKTVDFVERAFLNLRGNHVANRLRQFWTAPFAILQRLFNQDKFAVKLFGGNGGRAGTCERVEDNLPRRA